MSTEPGVLSALKARFAQDQGGVLEDIAAETGLTTREVMECLPPNCHCVPAGYSPDREVTTNEAHA